MEIEERIKQILVNIDKIEISKCTPNARLVEDLGMDSLDIAELVVELEKEYRIVIPDDDLDDLNTISDACDYMKKRLQKEKGLSLN